MNKTLRAFHGDPNIKALYVERMKAHIAHDQLIKGTYAEGDPESDTFRGCAVGCTLHSADHADAETEIGFPQMLMRLEDEIFEKIPHEDGQKFALEFLECVPVGADLNMIGARFLHWILVDETSGVIQFTDEAGAVAIRSVAGLYKRRIDGDEPTREKWNAAAYTAADAASVASAASAASAAAYAASAASAAAYTAAYAASAASAAAYTAAYAASAAADAAAYTADAAAYTAARRHQAQKLIELMRNAPVGAGE